MVAREDNYTFFLPKEVMKSVTIYTKQDCPYCLKSKELFQRNGVNYREIDVIADEFAWKEMVKKSGQLGVPVILIDDQIIIGYDENQLRKVLKLTK